MENRVRSEMDPRWQWKLEDIYADNEKWEEDYAKAGRLIARVAECAGSMDTAEGLLTTCARQEEASLVCIRLYSYARMRRDEDNGNTTYQALADRAQSLLVKLMSATAFFNPELIRVGHEKVEKFFAELPELER